MLVVRYGEQPVAEWRVGVTTRMRAAASSGAKELCVIEQRCAPGTGAPFHVHPDAEEVILVLAGQAEVVVGEERAVLSPGDAVVLPRGRRHAFTNSGSGELRLLAVFSAAAPVAAYEGAETFEIGGAGGRRRDAHRAYVDAGDDPAAP
jgi:quercetin dioxygenase-like cupin family protein